MNPGRKIILMWRWCRRYIMHSWLVKSLPRVARKAFSALQSASLLLLLCGGFCVEHLVVRLHLLYNKFCKLKKHDDLQLLLVCLGSNAWTIHMGWIYIRVSP